MQLQYLEGVRDGLILAGVLYVLTLLFVKSISSRRFSVPIDIKDLAKQTAEAEIDFKGEMFKVWYRPNVVTTRWIKSMRKAETEQDEDEMISAMCELIDSWELTSDGEKLPVTQETFDNLPLPLTMAITRGVMSHATGANTEEGKAA